MAIGTVKFFNTSKGFGFIQPEGGGKDVFVHATAVEAAGMRTLQEGPKGAVGVVPPPRGAKAAKLKARLTGLKALANGRLCRPFCFLGWLLVGLHSGELEHDTLLPMLGR